MIDPTRLAPRADLRARLFSLLLLPAALGACDGAATNPTADAAATADVVAVMDTPAVDAGSVMIDAPIVDDALAVDDDAPAADVFVTAPHRPQIVLPNRGGPVIQHPALVTITFAGDARRERLEAYARWIVGSDWITTVGAEYGVGHGTVAGSVVIPGAAPAMTTNAEAEAMLARGIQDGSIPTPPGGLGEAIYLLYYPAGSVIRATIGTSCGEALSGVSCERFGGYHSSLRVGDREVAYALIPDCAAAMGDPVAIENVETVVSHEVIEAATDPLETSTPGWLSHYDRTDPMLLFLSCGGMENADFCEIPSVRVREGDHVAQRIWSNVAAAAGGDPCLPLVPSLPYFNVEATPATVQEVAPGGSTQFTLRGWSTAPGFTWRLAANAIGPEGQMLAFTPTMSLSTTTMRNGGTATLTVRVPASAPVGSSVSLFLISRRSDADLHVAFAGVTVR